MYVPQMLRNAIYTGLLLVGVAAAQPGPSNAAAGPKAATTSSVASASRISSSLTGGTSSTITTAPSDTATSSPPDVYLTVPQLSVGRIELDVDELEANINLNAQVAGLVTLNAGVAVSIQKVNLTIADVDADLELVVRLGHLVDIVSRVFQSIDLNPSLITGLIGNVTQGLGDIVGAVDGLLGTITQGGKTLSFVIDNLGNIVQEVDGVSSIVGNYLQNMTDTGISKDLGSGLVQKEYSYSPLGSIVDIVFNKAGQVVQATVQQATGGSGSNSTLSR